MCDPTPMVRPVPLRLARFPPTRGQNPYLRLLYEHLSRFGFEVVPEPDFSIGWLWRARRDVTFLHFHWRPDKYYAWARPVPEAWAQPPARLQRLRAWIRLPFFVGRLAIARMLGYCLVWTIHEVYPPETLSRPPGTISRRLDRFAARALARSSHVLLAHDHATAHKARVELGPAADKIEVVPHGSYIGVHPRGRPRAAVREALGIPPDSFAFLCFGKLRRDKAIDLLLDAFRSMRPCNAILVVAGLVEDEAAGQSVLAAAAADPRIKPLLGFVPEDRVAELFEAADAAVLARGEVWTSGSLILALSLGVPAVAAQIPTHEELIGGGVAGWFFRPGDVASLRTALEAAAADPALVRAKGAAALKQAERLRWPEIAGRTAAILVEAYRTHSPRQPGPRPTRSWQY